MQRNPTITLDEKVYEQMGKDEEREAEALEWSEALIGDVGDEPSGCDHQQSCFG
jgi:hypothetical protein